MATEEELLVLERLIQTNRDLMAFHPKDFALNQSLLCLQTYHKMCVYERYYNNPTLVPHVRVRRIQKEKISQRVSNRCWDFKIWFLVKRIHLSCRLWEFGGYGFPCCEEHGFYHQSWITGKCRECQECKECDV